MDDQGYQQVPGLRNFTKSYLRGGQMTKDINGYLVLEILLNSTFRMNGWHRWVPGLRNFPKFYLREWRTTKDVDEHLVLKIVLSLTYRVDGRPRKPTGTQGQVMQSLAYEVDG